MSEVKKVQRKNKVDDVEAFYEELFLCFDDIKKSNDFPILFEKALLSGKNTVYQKDIKETKKFDETWIKTIESYFPSIDKITKNPKTALMYDSYKEMITNVKQVSIWK